MILVASMIIFIVHAGIIELVFVGTSLTRRAENIFMPNINYITIITTKGQLLNNIYDKIFVIRR